MGMYSDFGDGMQNYMTFGEQGEAQDALSQGYDQARNGMQPFYNGGKNAFNQWQQNATNQGNYLNQFNNMGANQWQASQQSAPQYYQQIMSSYQESPQAQYAQQQAARAGNAAGAASGMMGSGAYMNGMQRNANQISQGDQQQYFNNVMGANQAQMQDLNNYQNQYGQYNNMLGQQAGMGYGAAGTMGNWAMDNGVNQAQQDQTGYNNMMSGIGMIAGSMK